MERAKKGALCVGRGAKFTCKTVFCLPKNLNHVKRNETFCCNHPYPTSPKAPCTCWFVLPIGCIIGWAASIAGWIYFQNGINDVDTNLNKVGISLYIFRNIVDYFDFMEAFVNLSGGLTAIYGWREKHRTRFNELAHNPYCLVKFVACIIKSIVFLIAVFGCIVGLICFSFALVVYCVLWASNEACKGGDAAASAILDLIVEDDVIDDSIGFDDDAYQELCRQVKNSVDDAMSATIGGVVLLGGQVIILAYFFKYSTLALAHAYAIDLELDLPT